MRERHLSRWRAQFEHGRCAQTFGHVVFWHRSRTTINKQFRLQNWTNKAFFTSWMVFSHLLKMSQAGTPSTSRQHQESTFMTNWSWWDLNQGLIMGKVIYIKLGHAMCFQKVNYYWIIFSIWLIYIFFNFMSLLPVMCLSFYFIYILAPPPHRRLFQSDSIISQFSRNSSSPSQLKSNMFLSPTKL